MHTKLWYLQYRLVHRILTTNVTRNIYDKQISPLCTFCEKVNETYKHLFYECEYVMKLWLKLSKWLDYFCYIQFVPDYYEIIFNRYKDAFKALVNTVILITKQYIYAAKCQKNKLSITELLKCINMYRHLEKINAKRQRTLRQFQNKWAIYDVV